MLWIKFKRVLKAGFVGFWRNGVVSLASVAVMVVTLFVIGSVIFLLATLDSSLTEIKNKVDINVYFATSAATEDILALKKKLEKMPEVARAEYVSREDALANFKKKHENDALTLQALGELPDNPLGAILNVKARTPSQYESIANFLKSEGSAEIGASAIIEKVNYYDNKTAIDKLGRIIDSARKLGIALTIALVAISIIIVFNTIRLAIYIAREEISVMRLVGASNRYIRGPFVVTGVVYGFFAAALTLLIFYPLTYYLGTATENFFSGVNLYRYYGAHFGEIFGIIVGSGVFLGAVSSYLAVRRYLGV